jgi:hypothetical protein
MTEQKKQSSWFGRFLKVLLRLFLTLVFGILVGAALYFGFQFAYQQLVIPTQQNAADLQNFQTRVDQQWELLQDKNKELEDRVSQIESSQKNTTDDLSELMAQNDQAAADLDAYLIQQEDLAAQIDEINQSIIALMDQNKDLASQNDDLVATVEEMEVEKKLQPVYQDLQLFKVLLQINRSRLFLVQDNYGLAKQELNLADDLLNTLLLSATEEQENVILLWDARLNLAIGHLPDNPILANDDLEILWTMMANGFSTPEEMEVLENAEGTNTNLTPQPSATATATATPTPKP